MPKCKYTDYKCPHTPLKTPDEDGEKRCIFHSKNEDKDTEKFYKDFKNLYKSGDHNFHGFIFPKDFSFERLRKEAGIIKFKDAVFTTATFLCTVELSNAEFSGENGTDFRDAIFCSKGGTSFSWVTFSGQGLTNFNGAEFSGEGGTSFSWVTFSSDGGTSFLWTIFSDDGGTSFIGANFKGKVTNFSNAEFSGKRGTDFRDVKFLTEDETLFNGTTFSGKGGTYFNRANFLGGGGTYFLGTAFSGESIIDFSMAKFSGDGGTNFSGAKFSKCDMVDFSDTKFLGSGEVKFEYRTFYNNVKVNFLKVSFENPEKVSFDYVDLNCCRFIWTDLKKINFKQVFWTNEEYVKIKPPGNSVEVKERERLKVKKLLEKLTVEEIKRFVKSIYKKITKRIMVFDETYQRGFKKNKAGEEYHYAVQQLYNQLRLNYENSGRYHEAGDFFVGAMEMRRKGKKEMWIIKKMLTFYRLISFYGERPLKAFLWLFAVPFIFALWYLFLGIELDNGQTVEYFLTWPPLFFEPVFWGIFWDHFKGALIYSLSIMFVGKTECGITSPGSASFFVNILQIISSIVFISLFALAIRRKLRRTED